MKFIITGDISIKEDCESLFDLAKGDELFGDIVPLFKSADRVLVNLECAVTDKDTPIKKIGPNLKAPLNTVKTLKQVGVTDCGLSNNHIFDYGKAGIVDTLALLNSYGIAYTGFGDNYELSRKNHYVKLGKYVVAIIAVCEHEYSYALPSRMGARPYDPYDTNDDIVEAKKHADYVVVTYHGGKEHCRYPSPRLVKACRSMVRHGADVVLCQHSHCIGCYEQFEGAHILYGQGNFHFVCANYAQGPDGGEMWNTGLIVQLDVDKKLDVKFIPTVVDGAGIRLANDVESKRLLDELALRSKTLANGEWLTRWREFCATQSRYRIIPQEQREEWAHFLDCEAHTDVCREIYTTYNLTNELD